MMTIQVAIEDRAGAAALRDAIRRSGPWTVEIVATPDLALDSVIVVDEAGLDRLLLPLENPERIVLVARKDSDLSRAWDAGVVSVVSPEDAVPTMLLAVMAAALRAESAVRQRLAKRDISHSVEEELRH